jgi:hypothetical protein
MVELPKELGLTVHTEYSVEAHGKSCVDELFGICAGYEESAILREDISSVETHRDALRDGSRYSRTLYPHGAEFICNCVDPGPTKGLQKALDFEGAFHISRTYSFVSRPMASARHGVRTENRVFTKGGYASRIDYVIPTRG